MLNSTQLPTARGEQALRGSRDLAAEQLGLQVEVFRTRPWPFLNSPAHSYLIPDAFLKANYVAYRSKNSLIYGSSVLNSCSSVP